MGTMDEIGKNIKGELSEKDIVAELREAFREEAYELLSEFEAGLLELEKAPHSGETVERVFRALHTIKGSGATCEFRDIAAFTHELETVFDLVRKGKLGVTGEVVDLALRAQNLIKSMFDAYYHDGSVNEARTRDLEESINKLLQTISGRQTSASARPIERKINLPHVSPAAKGAPEKSVIYSIRFRPSPRLLSGGTDPLSLLNELRRLGSCKVMAQTDAIPYLDDSKVDECYTYWDVILMTHHGIDAIKDVFMFVKDDSELTIDTIGEDGDLEDQASYKRLGEILLERGDLTPEDLQEVLKERKRIGEMLVEKGMVSSNKVRSALVEQRHVREMRDKHQGTESISSIRVSTVKLDSLVNLVSELVTVQARLSQTAFSNGITEFLSIAEEVERLTSELRDNTMSIRMLPIGTMFSKFKRLVRDLSSELGKEIDLSTEGAETELDKTVIERLSDPLVHLIRNCIDHGIEMPEVRQSTGKVRRGTISLSAYHSGAHVYIEIKDDGAGMDTEAIRAKALERGGIQNVSGLPDKEIFGLVLMPGFSTARRVSSVSGRGVGLDVVKQAIDALRGNIEITSEQGTGTTITLKLPLTLAIIDGFLTKIGAEYYIFPLALVEECVELTSKLVAEGHGRNLISVRDHIVPYVRLREQFHIGSEQPHIEQIVITQVEDKRIGFVVDNIIGGHQTVIKNLGKFYRDVDGVSGATILGDGTVALILDVPKLVQLAVKNERESMQHANIEMIGTMRIDTQ
jgi:two-component system chemotaxis sensor kinase CheA